MSVPRHGQRCAGAAAAVGVVVVVVQADGLHHVLSSGYSSIPFFRPSVVLSVCSSIGRTLMYYPL